MSSATDLARWLVDELVARGLTDAVLCPGSRNAPLSFALVDDDRVRLHTRIDERTAGFLALGLARTSRRPVAVVTTSGTASANLHPAVLEAAHAGVPLVAVTADRPARLRGTGANQTTDQVRLFGTAAAFADLDHPDPDALAATWLPDCPLHLNVQLDEPLVPEPDSRGRSRGPQGGRGHGNVLDYRGAEPVTLPLGKRTVVVAGDDAGPPARRLAEEAGWPLLAEPSSGSRTGTHPVRTYRLLLGTDLGERVQRAVVFGHPTLSRPVSRLLAREDVEVVSVPARGRWATRPSPVDAEHPAVRADADDRAWLDEWRTADRELGRRIDAFVTGQPALTPYDVAAAVDAANPPGGLIVVGASNPIRDLDLMAGAHPVGERRFVLANRGLAGIDGTISTAIGAALGRPRSTRAIAYVGDVTFLHDLTALVIGPDEPRPDLTIVVANDDGGSIFATLEQGAPAYADHYERLFGTPHHVDLGAVCASTSTPHWRVHSRAELEHALASPNGGIEVVEAVIGREDRRSLDEQIRALATPEDDGAVSLAITLVAVATTVVVVASLCAKLDLPSPLVLIAVGVVGSYLPFVPDSDLRLSPELVLFGLLPPLLYAAAIQTSLVDFNVNRRPILLLSVGLVVFTTLGVGALVHAMLPGLGWPASLAIGAVVAPPDAVAATSIGRRIGLPRRIVTILEGESLFNDATALVALNTALASTIVWYLLVGDFVVAAAGGLVIGLAFFFVVGFARKHITDPLIDSALSFITPFAAYVAADEVHIPLGGDHVARPSGVVAVVVAGLLLGHKAPILQTAQSRIAERLNWRSIQFLLESAVFLLIGLQARSIIAAAFSGDVATPLVIGVCASTLVAVILLRLIWVFPARYLLVRPHADAAGRTPPWTFTFLLGWAGMRGVVTLAAAFVIPEDTPHREVLLLIAFTVTAGTLFLQGLSLPWIARRLEVPSPDPGADALARANLIHQATLAGLAKLDELDEDDPHSVSAMLRDRVLRRDNSAWERIGASEDETPGEIYNRRRQLMIDAERSRVLEIRDTGNMASEVVDQVLSMLDVEESMLDYSDEERQRVKSGVPLRLEGDCEHLQAVRPPVEADTPGECGDCLRAGTQWVHLRMCCICGHVACCDSSPERHASGHFHDTGHEVMRSAETGEDWRWCFLDELTG